MPEVTPPSPLLLICQRIPEKQPTENDGEQRVQSPGGKKHRRRTRALQNRTASCEKMQEIPDDDRATVDTAEATVSGHPVDHRPAELRSTEKLQRQRKQCGRRLCAESGCDF